MAYPEAITINPGMSCTLSVTFRPDHAVSRGYFHYRLIYLY